MTKVEELISVARKLPPESVEKLLQVAQAMSKKAPSTTRYQPISLGGLWQGITITEEDIQQVRQELYRAARY